MRTNVALASIYERISKIRRELDDISILMAKLTPNSLENDNPKPLTANQIIGEVCDYFEISTQDIMSKRRPEWITWPRQLAMHFIREYTQLDTVRISKLFNKKEHATVCYATEVVKFAMSLHCGGTKRGREANEVLHRIKKLMEMNHGCETTANSAIQLPVDKPALQMAG